MPGPAEDTARGGVQLPLSPLGGPPLPPPDGSPERRTGPGGEPLDDDDEAEPRRIVWVSLDPVRGRLDVYPWATAARIEAALRRDEESVELGCFGASVHFDAEGPDCHLQRTAGGRRDVCRCLLRPGDSEVAVRVYQPGRAWRVVREMDGFVAVGGEVCTASPGPDALDPDFLATSFGTAASAADDASAAAAVDPVPDGGDHESTNLLDVNSTSETERWSLWVSIDPRSGNVVPYPREVAGEMEAAWSRGESQLDLGSAFLNATVHLQDGPHQRTARGRRDVRRLVLARPSAPASLRVALGPRGWRAAAGDGGEEEERTVAVTPEVLVDLREVAAAAAGAAPRPPGPEQLLQNVGAAGENPSAALNDISADAQVNAAAVLWEWCRKDGQHAASAHSLPAEAWGVYSREQNTEIEEAFQAGQTNLEVSVGIRTYRIVFGPEAGFARQVDEALHKRRLVRRRVATHEECSTALDPAAPEVARGQESCPICCVDFAESAAMPVLELPGCQHVFHMACAQQLADSGSPCPCCRADVDWAALGLSQRRWRSRG